MLSPSRRSGVRIANLLPRSTFNGRSGVENCGTRAMPPAPNQAHWQQTAPPDRMTLALNRTELDRQEHRGVDFDLELFRLPNLDSIEGITLRSLRRNYEGRGCEHRIPFRRFDDAVGGDHVRP